MSTGNQSLIMVRFGIDALEPMSALASLGLAFVHVEISEVRLSLLAEVPDETLVVHRGDNVGVLARSFALFVGLNVPRIFNTSIKVVLLLFLWIFCHDASDTRSRRVCNVSSAHSTAVPGVGIFPWVPHGNRRAEKAC